MQWPTHPMFAKRLGITAAVLGAYCIGTNVPLPGLDTGVLAQLAHSPDASALSRLSIFSLGVMPLINTLLLLEVLKLVAPGFRQWELASFRNRDRLSIIVIGIALVMALLQAGGIVSALEDVTGLVPEGGSTFRAVAIATMIAGTALAMLFATVIDRAGLGCGIWLVFLTPGVAELPRTLAGIAVVNGQGGYGSDLILLTGVYSLLAIAGVVGIVLAARASAATVSTCIWTPFVATAVLTPAMFMAGWLATVDADWAVAFATPGHITWYLALALAVVGTVWLYRRSYAKAGEASAIAAAPIAATLAAILVTAPILETTLGAILPLGSAQLIVAATVAATLLVRWGFVVVGSETPVDEDVPPADPSTDQTR
jgi:preprotein translocase subunit SecY